MKRTTKIKIADSSAGVAPVVSPHSDVFRVEFVANGIPGRTLSLGSSKEEVERYYKSMDYPGEPMKVLSVTKV